MSNLEHYFENLLFNGFDTQGDINKRALTKEQQEAVQICAQYVMYTMFNGPKELQDFLRCYDPDDYKNWIIDYIE